jgi:hypothetical protein
LASDYEIFDLLVERSGSGYRARVISSPAGNETANLRQPISEDQFSRFLSDVGRPRRVLRRVGPSIPEETKKFGSDLLQFLLPDRIWTCFERSKSAAINNGRGLRIQIRLSDVPELGDLPWEFLYHDEAGFLALSARTPIVRFLEIRQPAAPLYVEHPLRILVLISSPRNLPPLDVDREWENLREALSGIASENLVYIERLDTPRLSRLDRYLRREPCHILHFIGHGEFNNERGSGELYFEDERGRSTAVTAEQLATALGDHSSVRLVILNACEGARSSRTDPFAGTAQALIRAGIPAVIAMQFEVTDDAAIAFSRELYTSIALGDPVDRSLSGARRAIYLDGNELEWATPVLYLRSPDSRIFALAEGPKNEERKAEKPEAAWLADEKRKAEEAEAARRAEEAEAARMAEEKRRAEEAEAARLAEEKRRAQEAEAARLAEEKRRAEEAEAARLAEEKRRAEEAEAARLPEERRKAEDGAQASNSGQSTDPTMEDILASIRRTLSEDERKAAQASNSGQSTDPAMEDILASIRRILSEDDESGTETPETSALCLSSASPEAIPHHFATEVDLARWGISELKQAFGWTTATTVQAVRSELERRGYEIRWSYWRGGYVVRRPEPTK